MLFALPSRISSSLADYPDWKTLSRIIFTNDPIVHHAASFAFIYSQEYNQSHYSSNGRFTIAITITGLLSVHALTFKFCSVFHYLSETFLSHLSELVSIYICPQFLLSNNKSQIHQAPCQVAHPWATEHSPAMPLSCGIP